jgi:hypothetical protein
VQILKLPAIDDRGRSGSVVQQSGHNLVRRRCKKNGRGVRDSHEQHDGGGTVGDLAPLLD